MKIKKIGVYTHYIILVKSMIVFIGIFISLYSHAQAVQVVPAPVLKLSESDIQKLKNAGFEIPNDINQRTLITNSIPKPIYPNILNARKSVNEIPVNDPIRNGFSDKALELNLVYKSRVVTDPMSHVYGLTHSAPCPKFYGETHFNEEYRPAWEEIYYDRVINGNDNEELIVPDYYMTDSLSETASTNSIPFFNDLYVKVLNENDVQKQHRKTEILKMLLCIDSPKALDIVFSLIDLTEDNKKVETPDKLRELLAGDLQKALQKNTSFKTYENPNLSEKNREFLDKAQKEEKEEVGD